MNATKISLSEQQMELVMNAELLLTKNVIIQKAKWLLEDLQNDMTAFVANTELAAPPEILISPPKISKGENYKGLPYLVLDYPRHFQKDNIFAIRCMFWWGNFFSITLHLTGNYKSRLENALSASYLLLRENDFYVCINDQEWEHHFEPVNYSVIREMTPDQFNRNIRTSIFMKVARKYSLTKWDSIQKLLLTDFQFLINLGNSQLPNR